MKGGDKTLAYLFTWTVSPTHLVFLWIIRNINFFFPGSGSKYFKFRGPIVHVSITPLCHYHMKVVIDNKIFKWTSLGANKTLLTRNTSWARFGPSPVLQKGFTSPSHYLRNTLFLLHPEEDPRAILPRPRWYERDLTDLSRTHSPPTLRPMESHITKLSKIYVRTIKNKNGTKNSSNEWRKRCHQAPGKH